MICEVDGCGKRATKTDVEGVPFCGECFLELVVEDLKEKVQSLTAERDHWRDGVDEIADALGIPKHQDDVGLVDGAKNIVSALAASRAEIERLRAELMRVECDQCKAYPGRAHCIFGSRLCDIARAALASKPAPGAVDTPARNYTHMSCPVCQREITGSELATLKQAGRRWSHESDCPAPPPVQPVPTAGEGDEWPAHCNYRDHRCKEVVGVGLESWCISCLAEKYRELCESCDQAAADVRADLARVTGENQRLLSELRDALDQSDAWEVAKDLWKARAEGGEAAARARIAEVEAQAGAMREAAHELLRDRARRIGLADPGDEQGCVDRLCATLDGSAAGRALLDRLRLAEAVVSRAVALWDLHNDPNPEKREAFKELRWMQLGLFVEEWRASTTKEMP